MSSGFLKSRIRGQVNSELNIEQVAEKLQSIGAKIVDEHSDLFSFEILQDNVIFNGKIERWEGTGTRIRYDGQTQYEPYNSLFRDRISMGIAVVIIILSIIFVVPLSIQIFGTDGVFTFYNTHYVVAFIVAGLITFPIVKFINRDPLAKKR